MANFGGIVLCLVLGIVLRASGRLPAGSHVTLNAVIVNIALPALTFASVRKFTFDPSLLYAIAMPWIVFALGAVFFVCLARVLALDRATTGGLLLTGALGNTSFIGLPMIETFFGRDSMRVGLLIDQLGSYLILSTVGLAAAAAFAGSRATPSAMLDRVIRFPPFQALVLTVLTAGVALPPWFDPMLMRLGEAIPMLAMLSVGSQLTFDQLAGNCRTLAIGLSFKLVLVPALIAALYIGLLPATMRATADVTIFEAAMAPMIGGGIVAAQYGLNAPLSSLMLGVGIPLSLVTVPGWWYVLRWLH
jgi:predicted permease